MYDSIDLFAGAGGWSVASRNLGLTDLGLELWAPAVATRDAAGLHSVQADIRLLNPLDDAFLAPGLIASPPCQQFSEAGNGEARAYMDTLCALIEHLEWQRASGLPEGAQLIMEPLRWIISRYAVEQPFRWIALEQVPSCLPVWQAYAVALRKLGYFVDCGIVRADWHGTPQTRKRAVLVAHLEMPVSLPAPTHQGRERCMADALGWHYNFKQISNYSKGGSGKTAAERGRGVRNSTEPSFTITSKGFRWSGSVNRTVMPCEMGVLQGFPVDFPWQGGIAQQRLQIGNAVPVQLAEAVLRAVAL